MKRKDIMVLQGPVDDLVRICRLIDTYLDGLAQNAEVDDDGGKVYHMAGIHQDLKERLNHWNLKE